MDFGELTSFNGFINHFFSQLLGKTEKIRHISNGWKKMPYWNIWLDGRDGVYSMELVDLDISDIDKREAVFNIKYYPAIGEVYYRELSIYEQDCRNSSAFLGIPSFATCECCSSHEIDPQLNKNLKEMGVPCFAFLDSIPQDFFLAGRIKIVSGQNGDSRLMMKALDRWRVLVTNTVCLTEHGNNSANKAIEKVDRNFPGYELTLFLYKLLEKSWGQFHNYPTYKVETREKRGFEFIFDGQKLHSRLADDISMRSITTIFSLR